MSIRLLLVEDEEPIRKMLCFGLESEGFEILEASTSEQAWITLNRLHNENQEMPDLILLDWMLPGASGLEFAQKLKKKEFSNNIPIIMLTARGEEDDRVKGLDAGADDYIVKPFSPRELIARIKAVLRRQGKTSDEVLQVGRIKLDKKIHQVIVDGTALHMGPTEYKILQFFLENKDRVFSRSQLLDSVWGQQTVIEERTVDVHIRRLRKVLSEVGAENQVHTVRGAGYRLSS
jgi:two-component system phosphate regulon response regulator PhoB